MRTLKLGSPRQAAPFKRLLEARERNVQRVPHSLYNARFRECYLDVCHIVRIAQHLVHNPGDLVRLHMPSNSRLSE